MSGMTAVLLALALAQQEDSVDRQVQRLREQLNLTDEQAGKAREIIKRQQDDLKSILTDEQKPRYDEALRGARGQGQGQGQGRGQGNFGRGMLPSTDDLKTRLGLSDDQATKINEIRDGIREEMRRMFQDRNNRPGPEAFEKIRDDATKKIRDVLTDEQKGKFDELVKSIPTPGQGGQERGGRGGSLDERAARVMELLKFEKPEEADAVKGLVKAVLELQDKLEAAQRESRGKLEELQRDTALTDEAVGDKLAELRKGAKELEKQLADARAKLSDVVSSRQEVDLLRRGVLR